MANTKITRATRAPASAPSKTAGKTPAANNIVTLGPNDTRAIAPTGFNTYTNMYKQHPIVRAAIDKLAKTAVASGYQFVARDQTKDLNTAHSQAISDAFARSKMKFLLRQTYTDLMIYGDAFWHITPSRLGVPYQFIRVMPSQMSVIVDMTTREVTSYTIRSIQGIETQYQPTEILHFRFFDPENDTYGLSLLQSLQSTVAQDLFAQTYNEAFFANSAQTGIVFNMKNASKEEVERNREFLKKEYVSAANAHKPLLLEGDVEVSKSVASPAEMQFIEGRRQLTTEILAVFDLPLSKLSGSASSSKSNAAEEDKSFRSEAIEPLQSICEEIINEVLIFEVFAFDDILFEHKAVDERSEADKMALYSEGLDRGIFAINEVRGKLGLKDIPGGEEPTINTPLGLIPVSMVAEVMQAQLDKMKAPPPAPFGGVQPGANPADPNAPPGQNKTGGAGRTPVFGGPGAKPATLKPPGPPARTGTRPATQPTVK